MSATKKHLLPILFFTLLLLHGLDSLFQLIPEPTLNERRVLTESPTFNINFLDPYPRDYEAYYNDHFNWRNYFIRASTYLNYHAFSQSSLPDKVIIGKDGWLFKSGFQMDLYRGKFRFSQQQLSDIQEELTFRKQQVENQGGKYYLCIPPMKPQVYPEFLPDNLRRLNNESGAQQLITYLAEHSDISYIDLFTPLKELKANSKQLLYLKTDHHWTDFSGLVAAKVIVDHLREDFPSLEPIDTSRFHFNTVTYDGMLLAEMLGLEKEMTETFPLLQAEQNYLAQNQSRDYPIPAKFPFPDEYLIVKKTEQTALPKLMMVRESFANPMINILGEQFRESVFLFDNWKHQFHPDMVAREKPDIYIQLIWEGMIYNLLENPPKNAGW